MLVSVVPDAVMGTNCYVLALPGAEVCLVVDPGFDVLDRLTSVLSARGLRPAAVLLTHGHADHVWSAGALCRDAGVPALVHEADAHRVRPEPGPLAGLSPQLRGLLEQHADEVGPWTAPDEVRLLRDGERLEVAGLVLDVVHAPGHTEGSAVFVLDVVPDGVEDSAGTALTSTVLSGDVLFAGSVGRTDLPGGDPEAMRRTLRDVVLAMPDDRLVLPGHGGASTLGRERRTNPHLRDLG